MCDVLKNFKGYSLPLLKYFALILIVHRSLAAYTFQLFESRSRNIKRRVVTFPSVFYFFLFLLRSLSKSVLTVLSVSWFTHNVDLRSINIRRLKAFFPFSVYFLFIYFSILFQTDQSSSATKSKQLKTRCCK